jgi:Ca-activated chloride channel homolog
MRSPLYVCPFKPRRFLLSAVLLVAGLSTLLALATAHSKAKDKPETPTPGSLQVIDASGKSKNFCPLKHTDVHADIAGFLARVTVTQEFENPFTDKIEAVYTFPLPQAAAVDDMTMKVGERTVRGKILRREEAQTVYEAARSNGQVASLLDQERPNIFTQSVANIMPGERVVVTISYVETLKYEDGTYEFSFPLVVGPRYVPGDALTQTQKGGGTTPDTEQVPDASRISPPVVPEGMRAGHDVSIDVALDAGVAVDELKSVTHEVNVERASAASARVSLKDLKVIPNKDFVLRYDVAGRKIQDAVLTHRDERGGYFTLILQPPDTVRVEDVTPKELVFVLDTSGSMGGFPIEKAKETMKLALDGLYPNDTFNLITFAGDTSVLFPAPVPATKENLAKAQRFLETREGVGGTEMMKAIKAALDPSDASNHVRIVCFMTDGYVGNDMEIISEVQKHPNARVFSFGIGSSVNHFLLDKMAEHGRGEVEYVSLNDDGSAAAKRFHERVRNPLLTDIQVDWGGLPVADVYPKLIPDLFSVKPVVLSGRFTQGGKGRIRLRGNAGGQLYEREIEITLPESKPDHEALATLWARRRIDDLMAEDYAGAQRGKMRDDVREAVTNIGLEYRLMTQFTSFVAVEEMTVTDGGQPRRVDVPVELPEGVNGGAIEQGTIFNQGLAGIANLPVNGRQIQSLYTIAPSAAAETVEVTASAPAVDTTQMGGTTKLDRGMIDPGSLLEGKGARLKRPRKKGGGGGGVAEDAKKLSPEEQKQLELQTKLHTSLYAIVESLKKNAAPSGDEAKLIRDGKVEIQIWLNEKSPETLAQLKALGFEVVLDPQSAKLVIGRLPVEKLAALTEIKAVRYVAPQK